MLIAPNYAYRLQEAHIARIMAGAANFFDERKVLASVFDDANIYFDGNVPPPKNWRRRIVCFWSDRIVAAWHVLRGRAYAEYYSR